MAVGDFARKAPPPGDLVKGVHHMPDGSSMADDEMPDDEMEDAVMDGLAEDIIAAGKDPTAFRIALDAYLDARKG